MAKKKAVKKYVPKYKNQIPIQNAFFERLRYACEKLIGTGYFETIPLPTLLKFFNVRNPVVKVLLDDSIIVGEKERKSYIEQFNLRLKTSYIETKIGESITYAAFMTDALLLIQIFGWLPESEFKGAALMKEQFHVYDDLDWYHDQMLKLYSNLSFYNYEYFDFYKGSVELDASDMRIYKPGGSNALKLCRVPTEIVTQQINDIIRPLARLGTIDHIKYERGMWAAISAEDLGLAQFSTQEKLPVYIQHHALRRYEQRSFSPMGMAYFHLGHILTCASSHVTVVRSGQVLLAHYIGGQKVGYFLITHEGDKWVIRTFLLLTNEGTPEGEKLKELTMINKIDSKYLRIDTMEAFIDYDIAGNEKLTAIFTEAGCASLIGYANFFNRTNLQLKNADFISKYLSIEQHSYAD